MKGALVIILFVTAVVSLHAQALLSNHAAITVRPNTAITVRGNVQSTGSIANEGHIRVSGSWRNAGSYAPGMGEVTLNGTSQLVPQTVDHNGHTIGKLTLEGTSEKIVRSDLVVSHQITFTGGILEVLPGARFQMLQDVVISGPSDQSHVQGAAFHRGSGYKLFPIGSGGIYMPVELTNVADERALVGISVMDLGNQLLSTPVSLGRISGRRYWHVEVAAGTTGNSPIVLPVRDELNLPDLPEIVVAQAASLNDDFMSLGQAFHEGETANGRISSREPVTKPYVALATVAEDVGVTVYNAVSANGDGMNDFLRIQNIEYHPENTFSLFSRWGDRIFYVEGYNNEDKVFRGRSNLPGDKQLVSGTYFYVIEIPGRETLRGFINLKH